MLYVEVIYFNRLIARALQMTAKKLQERIAHQRKDLRQKPEIRQCTISLYLGGLLLNELLQSH